MGKVKQALKIVESPKTTQYYNMNYALNVRNGAVRQNLVLQNCDSFA